MNISKPQKPVVVGGNTMPSRKPDEPVSAATDKQEEYPYKNLIIELAALASPMKGRKPRADSLPASFDDPFCLDIEDIENTEAEPGGSAVSPKTHCPSPASIHPVVASPVVDEVIPSVKKAAAAETHEFKGVARDD
jgi:hypothetical protein